MGRKPCCAKEGLNRGTWSAREDQILTSYIKVHGEGKWRDLPRRAGLKRCGKSCRLRWLNYLRPDIKRGSFSVDEEELIIRLHKLLGNRWSLIAGRLPGRTDNDVKNYWNSSLRKKVEDQKITILTTDKQVKLLEEEKKTVQKPLEEKSNSVVRTKAVRCTKVIMLDTEPIKNDNDNNNNNDNTIDDQRQMLCSSPSSSKLQVEDNSLDLLMDMEIDDLLLLENNVPNGSLGFDQPDNEEINYNNERNENEKMVSNGQYSVSSCWDFPVSTQQEGDDGDAFMGDARPFQQYHDHDGFDLRSISDFLGLEEEWFKE